MKPIKLLTNSNWFRRTTSNPTDNSIAKNIKDAEYKADASTKHKVYDEERKKTLSPDAPASQYAVDNKGKTNTKTPKSQSSGNVSKRTTMNWFRRHPNVLSSVNGIKKFSKRHKKGILAAAALTIGTMAISKLNSSFSNRNNFVKTPKLSNMDNTQ